MEEEKNQSDLENAENNVVKEPLKLDEFQKINKRAIPVWRVGEGFGSLFWWLIPLVVNYWGGGYDFPLWIISVLTGLVIVNTILRFTILPYIRWKYWSYRINEHEIELRRGVIIKVNTLIPINRVQHVDTRQGPLMRSYELATVTISTAATTHEIPALTDEVADLVREKISNLARKAREDV